MWARIWPDDMKAPTLNGYICHHRVAPKPRGLRHPIFLVDTTFEAETRFENGIRQILEPPEATPIQVSVVRVIDFDVVTES